VSRVVSPPLLCSRCRVTRIQHAQTDAGVIPVEIGEDPSGDVVLDRRSGRLLARVLEPGETPPAKAARLQQHRCPAATEVLEQPVDGPGDDFFARYLDSKVAARARQAGISETELHAVAVFLDVFGIDSVEVLGRVVQCHGGCGRELVVKQSDWLLCPTCRAQHRKRH
jgi:hypothetical protein